MSKKQTNNPLKLNDYPISTKKLSKSSATVEGLVVFFKLTSLGTKRAFYTSMHAKTYDCVVKDIRHLTPTVLGIRFEADKFFSFVPGQFLSLIIPTATRAGRASKRCYSFSSGPEMAKRDGYELCVKYIPGGIGSEFLIGLKPGDRFLVAAPYGDFQYKTPEVGRHVCFIGTGTGIAPFRSMILSKQFHLNPPQSTTLIFGAKTEKDILYQKELVNAGIRMVCCLTQPTQEWRGFVGRVTDYLKTLPTNMAWNNVDFYVCGNGKMVQDVVQLLKTVYQVADKSIFRENFTPAVRPAQVVTEEVIEKKVA